MTSSAPPTGTDRPVVDRRRVSVLGEVGLVVALGLAGLTALLVAAAATFSLDGVDRAAWHEAAIGVAITALVTLALGVVVRASYRPSGWYAAALAVVVLGQVLLVVHAVGEAGLAQVDPLHSGPDSGNLALAAGLTVHLPTTWPLLGAALAGLGTRLRGR